MVLRLDRVFCGKPIGDLRFREQWYEVDFVGVRIFAAAKMAHHGHNKPRRRWGTRQWHRARRDNTANPEVLSIKAVRFLKDASINWQQLDIHAPVPGC